MMKCRECNTDMYLDDNDHNGRGNRDEYWECPCCATSCIRKVRFGLVVEENWHSEINGKVTDEVIEIYG